MQMEQTMNKYNTPAFRGLELDIAFGVSEIVKTIGPMTIVKRGGRYHLYYEGCCTDPETLMKNPSFDQSLLYEPELFKCEAIEKRGE